MKEVQHQYCLLSKRYHKLKQNIADTAKRAEVVVDEELHVHNDLITITITITTNNASVVKKEVPANSFIEKRTCSMDNKAYIDIHITHNKH